MRRERNNGGGERRTGRSERQESQRNAEMVYSCQDGTVNLGNPVILGWLCTVLVHGRGVRVRFCS